MHALYSFKSTRTFRALLCVRERAGEREIQTFDISLHVLSGLDISATIWNIRALEASLRYACDHV